MSHVSKNRITLLKKKTCVSPLISNVVLQNQKKKNVEKWDYVISENLKKPEKVINQMINYVRYPIITDKTYNGLIQKNQFTFDVDQRLTKSEIKTLFENLFQIKVISINTLIPPRKKIRVGAAHGFKPNYKRAIVKLKEGQSLKFLEM